MSTLRIPMAIAYDLDETLSVDNMLSHIAEDLNIDPHDFFDDVVTMAEKEKGSRILCCLALVLQGLKKGGITPSKEFFTYVGSHFTPFPGVMDWFDRINAYALGKGIELKHYVITSNLREIVAGTPLATKLERIYGSAFMYDEQGVACWPANAVDYTGKTQFLFRISKGVLEESDDDGVNARIPSAQKHVPFSNIIYVGDGETDIPCMTVAREQGGYAIAVYNPEKDKSREIGERLFRDNRVDRAVPADYREGSRMDRAVKAIIDSIAAKAALQAA